MAGSLGAAGGGAGYPRTEGTGTSYTGPEYGDCDVITDEEDEEVLG